MNYAVRITFPAEKLVSFFSRLSMVSERLCVYEHSEDVSSIHCHIIIWQYQGDVKNIKRWAEETLNLKIDKTKISIKSQYKPKGTVQSVPIDEGAISYASKGKYEPKYVKGWNDEEVNVLKAKGFDKKDKPVKLSADLIWYNDFEKEFLTQPNQVPTDQIHFCDLVKFAKRYNFKKIMVSNPAYHTKVKMCVETFCMYYGTSVPDDKDYKKRYYV